MIPNRLIENNCFAFKIYAAMFRIREKFLDNKNDDRTGSNGPRAETFADMIRLFREDNNKIYGEDIILAYEEGNKKTALFVIHELSLTGAPIVMYNFVALLHKNGWQTVILSPKDGPMGEFALDHGVPVIVIPEIMRAEHILKIRNLFSKIIVGTILCGPVIKRLNSTDSDVIWWIHEAESVYVELSKELARIVPLFLSNNIHVYCAGKYAQRVLKRRFPQYRAEELVYFVDDIFDNYSLNSVDGNACSGTMNIKKAKSGNKKIYACVALIQQRKGQDILLAAIDMLPDDIKKNSLFVFVGATADDELKEMILRKKAEQRDSILFYEGLAREELFELYSEIDYLICPSRDDPMPVVVAEAMAVDKPCICSQNTGSADIIEGYDAGYTYDKDDPRRLAKLITDAHNITDEKYKELSHNARRAYEDNFSEEVFEEKVMEIMR